MSARPTVVFLDGVGSKTHYRGWRKALESGLQAVGYALEETNKLSVVSPRYSDLLSETQEPDGSMPSHVEVRPPSPAVRAAYEQSQARLRRSWGTTRPSRALARSGLFPTG